MLPRNFKIIILIILLGFSNIEPEESGGMTAADHSFLPENSRLTNSFSDHDYYDRFDSTVEYFLRSWDIKGASLAVYKDGRLVLAKGYGLADTRGNTEVQPWHRFRIASVSKLITATAILKLYQDSRLDLNQKVFGPGGILNDPYFSDPKDKRVYDITVAHLLSHRGGWTTRWGDQMFMPHVVASSLGKETPVDTRDVVRFVLNKRLHFPPGKGRSYSNLGYAILGLVIAEVSGQSYEEYCKKELFEPLGIYDISLGKNLYSQRDPYEVRYFEPSNALPKKSIYGSGDQVPASNGGNDIEALGGAGGWIATAPDLLKFIRAIDGFSDVEDILSPQTVKFMTDNSNGWAPVGWKGSTANGYWWRTGSFAGTSAMVRRYPDGMIWVALFNTNTWKQSKFPSDVSSMLTRAISRTNNWTDEDLFEYNLPVPLENYPFITDIH
ncbi:MAG: serine hydrolase domain-containing protein [Marinilabiliaceae bacterium]|jgi:CubicO group peptidase (beta-lactamase class C family)|nr:serine hydrolase domain-containing protein [Marinilabiliaceae bacterium]